MKKLFFRLLILTIFSVIWINRVLAEDCLADPDSCYNSSEAISSLVFTWESGGNKDIMTDNTFYYDSNSLYTDSTKSVKICERVDQEMAGEFSGTETYTGVQNCDDFKVSVTVAGAFLSRISSTAKIKAKINVDGGCDFNGQYTQEKTVGTTTSDIILTSEFLRRCRHEIFNNSPKINFSIYLDDKEIKPPVVYSFITKPLLATTQCVIDFTNVTQGGSTKCVNPASHCIDFLGASIDDSVKIDVSDIDSLGYPLKLMSNSELLNSYPSTVTEANLTRNFSTAGNYVIKMTIPTAGAETVLCQRTLNITARGEELIPPGENIDQEDLNELEIDTAPIIPLCQTISDPKLRMRCEACQGSGEVVSGIWTGIGCMPTNFSGIVGSLFTLFSGLMGGFVFLCLVSNGLKIMASRGNSEALKKGQEAITACLVGFVVLVLSVLFLKIVGVNILNLPGWN